MEYSRLYLIQKSPRGRKNYFIAKNKDEALSYAYDCDCHGKITHITKKHKNYKKIIKNMI